MLFLLEIAVVLVFPAMAVRVWRRSGARGLSRLTIGALCLLALAALVLASETAGNQLAATEGYITAAGRLLALFTLAAGAPVLAAAYAVPAVAARVDPRLLYAVAVLAALAAVVISAVVVRVALL